MSQLRTKHLRCTPLVATLLLTACAPSIPSMSSGVLQRLRRDHPLFVAEIARVRMKRNGETQSIDFALVLRSRKEATVDFVHLSWLGAHEAYLVGDDGVYYDALRLGSPAPSPPEWEQGIDRLVVVGPDRPVSVKGEVLIRRGTQRGPRVVAHRRGLSLEECDEVPPGRYRLLCYASVDYYVGASRAATAPTTVRHARWLVEYPGTVCVGRD